MNNDIVDERKYTIDEAAVLVRRKRVTLYRWMAAGALGYVQVGGKRLIPHSALQAVHKRVNLDRQQESTSA